MRPPQRVALTLEAAFGSLGDGWGAIFYTRRRGGNY